MPLPRSKTPAEPTRPRLSRSCRYCPRTTQTEGLNGYIISRLTHGFSNRCLRFTSAVASAHARLASGWRAAPLPGGGRTLWIAPKGSGYIFILLSGTLRVARVVYAKPPLGGPKQVLAYLGRYTHRVAIANSPLIGMEEVRVAFRWKDYRHRGRTKVMTLHAHEFIRRFLLHTLPDGFPSHPTLRLPRQWSSRCQARLVPEAVGQPGTPASKRMPKAPPPSPLRQRTAAHAVEEG